MIRKLASRTLLPALLAAAVIACDDGPTAPVTLLPAHAVDLAQPWVTATPAEVGFDDDRFRGAVAQADGIRSLVIVRNGYLVHEWYAGGVTRDSLHDVRSVTKSVLSALVGIAIREGVLTGVDQTIDGLLPPAYTLDDDAKRTIRVRHLLAMTSGFAWNENGAVGYNEWISSADHVRYLLDKPLSDMPGTIFNYNSAATHVLGVILAHAAGEPLPEWARRNLFEPIGITDVAWEGLPGGHVNGSSGIDLLARDLARLGQLFLQNGASGIRQVVPIDWTETSTRPRFLNFGAVDGIDTPNYGLLWWIEADEPDAFFAWGHGGQFVYVVPDRNLVIVLTTQWRGVSTEGRSAAGLRIIRRFVDAAR